VHDYFVSSFDLIPLQEYTVPRLNLEIEFQQDINRPEIKSREKILRRYTRFPEKSRVWDVISR